MSENVEFLDTSSWNFPKIKWLGIHMTGHAGFIAGGCFKQIFSGQRVKDIDVFFSSEKDFSEACIYFKGNVDYAPYYTNKKVEAFKHTGSGVVVELIRSTFGSPQDVIGNFDFTITKFAYYKHIEEDDNGEETLTYRCLYHPLYFEHLMLKRLVVDDKIPFPASTFERLFRYGKYGYFPCRETKATVVKALRDMPSEPDLSASMYDGLD